MPKSKHELDNIKQMRKKQIAFSGLKVFCEKGYDGTTVDDIVKRANCSHGLFYHYYKSKKEIFDEVIKINHDDKQNKLKTLIENTHSYAEKLKLILQTMFNELKTDENFSYYYYFFVSQSFASKEKGAPPKSKRANRKPAMVFLEELFSQGQLAGKFTDKYTAKECAILFLSIIQGATLGYVIAPKEIQQTMKLPNIDLIVSTFLKGDSL